MPNWCSNQMKLTHDNPAMMGKAVDNWNSGQFLEKFFPMPHEFHVAMPSVEDFKLRTHPEYWRKFEEMNKALLLKYFGYESWYEWRLSNWGIKWDIGQHMGDGPTQIDNGVMVVEFESPWGPPLTAYEKLSNLGYKIEAKYNEPGMTFCGTWNDGEEDYFDYGGVPTDQIRKYVGQELDDFFRISIARREYEEEMGE